MHTLKHKTLLICSVLIILLGCQNNEVEKDFLITNDNIGALYKDAKVNQLDSIFAKDSVVKNKTDQKFMSGTEEIYVYSKDGETLLILEAEDPNDLNSTIENIQIVDERFQTKEGISKASYFKDLKAHYEISKINNTLSAAVVFIDSIGGYFTIDKKELNLPLGYGTDQKIEANQIPDSAKIKHFLISWDTP